VTRSGCLRRMRRLVPSVARREGYAARKAGRVCEVGYVILSGRGDRGPRETHSLATARTWAEAWRKAWCRAGQP
jgi:hypothetical protein